MSVNLIPDIAEAARFLAALDPAPNAKFGFATFDDRGNDPRLALRIYGDLHQAIRLTGRKRGQLCNTVSLLSFMQTLGAGVFVTVQQLDGAGAAAQHVNGIRAPVADADTDEQLATLSRFIAASGLVPSIIVATGGLTACGAEKLQMYWLVANCGVAAFSELQALLLSRAGTDPAVKDLPRVLRLVGFGHQKGEPRRTRIVSLTSQNYDCSDFLKRVRAQPQIIDVGVVHKGVGSGTLQRGQARYAGTDGDSRTARLRFLLDRHGGLITASVHALLREAQAPTDGAPGNRHTTLVTIAARLAPLWPDADIRQLVVPAALRVWDVDPRELTDRLDRILRWVRQREAATLATLPSTTWPGRSAASVGNRGAVR